MELFHRDNIVSVAVSDPAGRNRKIRPVAIVSDPQSDGEDIVGVAISTRVEDPCPGHHVPLPWTRQGHPKTGLNKPNVAKCDWLVQFSINEIQNKLGTAPGVRLLAVTQQVRRLLDSQSGS
jgi:mRNA-degrading endonuclease toxin of MazEF toxin-antitoxin module